MNINYPVKVNYEYEGPNTWAIIDALQNTICYVPGGEEDATELAYIINRAEFRGM